jgi:hypothetical protein
MKRLDFSSLKGQCHEVFDIGFFSRIYFPQAPECPVRDVSKFVENSRRYSQLYSQVHQRCRWHQWKIEKITFG